MNNRNNPNLVNIYNKMNLDIEMGSLKEPVTGTGDGLEIAAPTGYYFTKIFNQSTEILSIDSVTGLQGGNLGGGSILQGDTWLIPCVSFTPQSGSYCAYLAPLLTN